MTLKPLSTRLGSLFICCLSTLAAQAQDDSTYSADISEINILPEICVRHKSNAQCQFKLDVNLQLKAKMDVCMVIESLRIRQCLEQVSEAKFQRLLTINEDVKIDIINRDTGELLYSSILKLAEFQPVNLRPRRNLGWIL
ncbi:DUF3019 domain-containing protein [Thalassotalea sp. PS06]|uniref:DUF3019 domain-containing protein n=1 Tax=Thalassotalea sp. PS06 TaxID=2594005 RepID=UPI001163ED22|nr:DUF3019 domain-containing protein [Thalassotalea sp. PS06]QDP02157.1 DUF3019 domain-containing protein [Thalassotalea sp. PS06]